MNRLTALRTMLWAALMAASSAAVGAPPGGVPGIAPGSPAPEIAGPMLRGEPLRLSGLRGKVVLVDFWASYCGPCILAMPEINRIRTDLHAQGHAQHFEVVGVAMDRESDKAEQFLARVSVDYPIIIDTLGLAAHSYGGWRLPATYLIDAEGTIQRIWYGFGDTFAADIRHYAEAFLAARDGPDAP